MKKLVICGGGSSAHTLIPLLSKTDFEVSVLTSKPQEWSHTIDLDYKNPQGEVLRSFQGNIAHITSDPQACIPHADYIVLCMPVHKYRVALHNIVPYINQEKNVMVGTVYGQGGFNWMVDEIKAQYDLQHIVTFAFGLIPWICRIEKYGHKGITYGPKVVNAAAVSPREYFPQLASELFDPICYEWFGVGKTEPLDNFLSITLSADNQIIHPTRCYGLYKVHGSTWNTVEEVPLFYKDYDEFSGKMLANLDDDYTKIRECIKQMNPNMDFHYMLNYLDLEHYTYHSRSVDIVDSFVNSPTLQAIRTPVVANDNGEVELDKNCRFFMDDIYYGVAIAKWIAEQLRIDTPTIDKILHWAQELRSERIISADNHLILDSMDLATPMKSGIPYYYGMTKIEDILN